MVRFRSLPTFVSLFALLGAFVASEAAIVEAAAPADNRTPVIIESFTYKNSYYLALSDGSRFTLKAMVVEKGGWFNSTKYGNPAAHWLLNDRIMINRIEGFEFPFQLINLDAQEEALAAYYNPHMEGIENVHALFQSIMEELHKQSVQLNQITKELDALKKSSNGSN